MAETIYKLTTLTDADQLSESPCTIDEMLAAAAAGYDPLALAAKKATESLKHVSEQLKITYGIKPLELKVPEYDYDYKIQKEIYNMAGFNFGGLSRFDRQMREKQAEMLRKQQEAEEAAQKAAAEEWIWVEGFKGTNSDMKCRDYQFEMHKQFDIPEGREIVDCECGFHFCRDLKDVFDYYKIGEGHRFFRVRGLVRKEDYENYGKQYRTSHYPESIFYIHTIDNRDKLAAKSIQFLYELTPDEVFATFDNEADVHTWNAEKKALAMKHTLQYVRQLDSIDELIKLGYSEAFADYIVTSTSKFSVAKAVGTQTDLSMDMKVLYILKG